MLNLELSGIFDEPVAYSLYKLQGRSGGGLPELRYGESKTYPCCGSKE